MTSRVDPDTFLNDLDAAIFLQLTDILAINGTWRKLINVVTEGNYSAADVHSFEQATFRLSEPASVLLQDLGNKGLTVGRLIPYLETLQLERALVLIKDFEPVKIINDLPSHVEVEAGLKSHVRIECNTTGFPRPSFQWFKCIDSETWTEIFEQNTNTLHIQPVRYIDKGLYCCRVCNQNPHCKGQREIQFTNHVFVNVRTGVTTDKNEPMINESPPIIILHPGLPSRGSVYMGANLIFECQAKSAMPITYEWFKDGSKIEAANKHFCTISIEEGKSILQLRNVQPENDEPRFTIQCKALNCYGEILSKAVVVSLAAPSESAQYMAEDKVALLIGNNEYTNHQCLPNAETDIICLAKMLVEMDFKVVTLSNLNEYEMHNAVEEFCKLLDTNVYGVFYYAGHGFQSYGQSYMIPVTADEQCDPRKCLCLENVEARMQLKNPALCFLILDMCRNNVLSSSQRNKKFDEFKPKVNRNTIKAYATTYSCSALDGFPGQNGLFMKYLGKHITSKKPVKEVLDNVVQDISVDTLASKKQFPEILFNLSRRLSLADKICCKNLSKYEKRGKDYEFLINLPRVSNWCIMFNEININIEIEPYKQVLHNVLNVKLSVSDVDLDEKCIAYANQITTSEQEEVNYIQEYISNDGPQQYTQLLILQLQKLRGSIFMDLCLFRNVPLAATPLRVSLGAPLIAQACLWRRPTSESKVDDTDYDEDESGFVSTFQSNTLNC